MFDLLKSISPITWLFITLWMAAIFLIRLIWFARREWTLANTIRDREEAIRRADFAFIAMIVIMAVLLWLYIWNNAAISRKLAAGQENSAAVAMVGTPPPPPAFASPTATVTQTPAPVPSEPLPTSTLPPTVTPTSLPTATPRSQPAVVPPTPTSAASLGEPPDCPVAGAKITSPGNGAQVDGLVDIFGSADVDNFNYYKFEFRPAGGDWSYIQHFTVPVSEGALGRWNSDTVPPGSYQFRLVVVDAIGNYPEPCLVSLNVQ